MCKKVRKIFKEKKYYNINSDIDYELKYIILNVITKYVNYSSWDLSLLSHNENAWKKARIREMML